MKMTLKLLVHALVAIFYAQVHSFQQKYRMRLFSMMTERQLDMLSSKWKMVCYDADDGLFGLDSSDPLFGVEIVKCDMPTKGGFGLNLIEYCRVNDGKPMVFVESICPGSNAAASNRLRPGDTLTYIGQEPHGMTRLEGLELDSTLATLNSALIAQSSVTIVAKRLVKRTVLNLKFIDGNLSTVVTTLAGSNLRSEMMKADLRIYDPETKRFDQPYATGDCGGEGICGTCLVDCISGMQHLNKPDRVEKMALKNRPQSWRLSCRTVIGADNAPGNVDIKIRPQLRRKDISGTN